MNDLFQYGELRESVKTGDAAFFSGTGLGSQLIKWRTKGPWTHVATFIWVTFHQEKRLMLAHANYPEGVTMVHASNYFSLYQGKISLARVNHTLAETQTPHHETKLADYLAQQTGRAYDVKGVLKFVLPWNKEAASRWFCSELFIAGWNSLGFTFDKGIHPNKLARWGMIKSWEVIV